MYHSWYMKLVKVKFCLIFWRIQIICPQTQHPVKLPQNHANPKQSSGSYYLPIFFDALVCQSWLLQIWSLNNHTYSEEMSLRNIGYQSLLHQTFYLQKIKHNKLWLSKATLDLSALSWIWCSLTIRCSDYIRKWDWNYYVSVWPNLMSWDNKLSKRVAKNVRSQ